jgi:hypothetical protein
LGKDAEGMYPCGVIVGGEGIEEDDNQRHLQSTESGTISGANSLSNL